MTREALEKRARRTVEELPPGLQAHVGKAVLGHEVWCWTSLTHDELTRVWTKAHIVALVFELAP
jgi:hypothetical protein